MTFPSIRIAHTILYKGLGSDEMDLTFEKKEDLDLV